MSNLIHETKTPMTTILGLADTSRTYDCDVGTRKKCADYTYTEDECLEKLSYILMDLLSLSGRDIQLQSTSIASMAKQLRQYYGTVSVTDWLCFHCAPCTVYALEELFFSALRNLTDNAIRTSDAAQEILVKEELCGKNYRISVTNHGIGMWKEDIQQISQPFYMVNKPGARQQDSTGPGLSIVR